jgi:hypothetical protein
MVSTASHVNNNAHDNSHSDWLRTQSGGFGCSISIVLYGIYFNELLFYVTSVTTFETRRSLAIGPLKSSKYFHSLLTGDHVPHKHSLLSMG